MDKQGFTTYLEGKDFSTRTIECYIKRVDFFFGKYKIQKEDIKVTKPDILDFLEYLKNSRVQQSKSRTHYLVALNHYFNFLYEEGQIAQNPCWFLKLRGAKKKKLYNTYTPEELETLFDNYYQLFIRNFNDSHYRSDHQRNKTALCRERNIVILSILINQGITTGEIEKIELDDIDLFKAKIKIRGGRKSKERTLSLKATQIGLIMNYLEKIRPQLSTLQTGNTNYLFFALPSDSKCTKKQSKEPLLSVFKQLAKQIQHIDKKFLKFTQIRVSVITSWLKTQNLRKTQYMAGHSNISSTEYYLSNNLDDLTENIHKLNPFNF